MDKFEKFLSEAKEIESEVAIHFPDNSMFTDCMSEDVENYLLSLNNSNIMDNEVETIYQSTCKSLNETSSKLLKNSFLVTFSKTFAVEINVKYDPESNVYTATSSDITGLVIEAKTLKQLLEEIEELIRICLK